MQLLKVPFTGNNVHEVTSVAEAYNLAQKQSGVILTDLPILHTKELGLPQGATQLVYNHGKILGRRQVHVTLLMTLRKMPKP